MKRTYDAATAEHRRQQLGLTYRELASRVGCTERTAISVCKGESAPRADLLAALADALEIDMNKLFKRKKGGKR